MSLLRVMFDALHDVCCNSTPGNLGTDMAGFEELDDWLAQATDVQTTLCGSRVGITARTYGDLPGVYDSARDISYVIVHPLWSVDSGPGLVIQDAIADAFVQDSPGDIRYVNTFDGMRRPSYCLR